MRAVKSFSPWHHAECYWTRRVGVSVCVFFMFIKKLGDVWLPWHPMRSRVMFRLVENWLCLCYWFLYNAFNWKHLFVCFILFYFVLWFFMIMMKPVSGLNWEYHKTHQNPSKTYIGYSVSLFFKKSSLKLQILGVWDVFRVMWWWLGVRLRSVWCLTVDQTVSWIGENTKLFLKLCLTEMNLFIWL